jgi:hypothetical protein
MSSLSHENPRLDGIDTLPGDLATAESYLHQMVPQVQCKAPIIAYNAVIGVRARVKCRSLHAKHVCVCVCVCV